jgi:hypothetical protein
LARKIFGSCALIKLSEGTELELKSDVPIKGGIKQKTHGTPTD